MHPFPHRYRVSAQGCGVGRVTLRHDGVAPLESSPPVEFGGQLAVFLMVEILEGEKPPDQGDPAEGEKDKKRGQPRVVRPPDHAALGARTITGPRSRSPSPAEGIRRRPD